MLISIQNIDTFLFITTVKSLKEHSCDLGGQFHIMGARNEAAGMVMYRLLGCDQSQRRLFTFFFRTQE